MFYALYYSLTRNHLIEDAACSFLLVFAPMVSKYFGTPEGLLRMMKFNA